MSSGLYDWEGEEGKKTQDNEETTSSFTESELNRLLAEIPKEKLEEASSFDSDELKSLWRKKSQSK